MGFAIKVALIVLRICVFTVAVFDVHKEEAEDLLVVCQRSGSLKLRFMLTVNNRCN